MGSLLVFTSSRWEDKPSFKRVGDQGEGWREAVVSAHISNNENVRRVLEIIRCLLARECKRCSRACSQNSTRNNVKILPKLKYSGVFLIVS